MSCSEFEVVRGACARFQRQQGGLAAQAAGITGQRAVGTEHPVTGHDDTQRVAADGRTDRTDCVRPLQRAAERAVGGASVTMFAPLKISNYVVIIFNGVACTRF